MWVFFFSIFIGQKLVQYFLMLNILYCNPFAFFEAGLVFNCFICASITLFLLSMFTDNSKPSEIQSCKKTTFFFIWISIQRIFCGVMFLGSMVFIWCSMSDAIIACMLTSKIWQWKCTSCDDQKYLLRVAICLCVSE